ncbi:MAG: hypothetical protein O8C58_05645 [Candidatus Methanoperedens sp.]|nr:hypothetical protein [Candidatus Methanoperedens sp.]
MRQDILTISAVLPIKLFKARLALRQGIAPGRLSDKWPGIHPAS